MGRQKRPNIPGGIYHVMNRGNRKAPIFEDERDRRRFLRTLTEQLVIYEVKLLGGCLMSNHFHLALLTPLGNLSEFMEQLEGQFARYANWRHGYVGHLFQGRFRHVLLENDIHLLTALCYIFMNPVAAGLVTNPEDYKWSTFAATVGLSPMRPYLSIDWLEPMFPSSTLAEAQLRFRRMLSQPAPVTAYIRDSELNVSGEAIKQVIRSYTGEHLQVGTIPQMYRTALRPSLETLMRDSGNARCRFIKEARVTYGYRNAEIARSLGLRPSTVSKIFCSDLRQSLKP